MYLTIVGGFGYVDRSLLLFSIHGSILVPQNLDTLDHQPLIYLEHKSVVVPIVKVGPSVSIAPESTRAHANNMTT